MTERRRSYLLDTCALIWIVGGDRIAEEAEGALNEAFPIGRRCSRLPDQRLGDRHADREGSLAVDDVSASLF